MKNDKIIQCYIRKKSFYESLTKTISSLLEILLKESDINYQKIEARTKSVRSLENKVYRKSLTNTKYQSLNEISDLSGVRIIVFFKDDIQRVVDLLEHEFAIYENDSVDMELGIMKNPKEFGYQSQHRVISINNHRSHLKEYSVFRGAKCEVQIRTVLQHAWAEIEHDIGYKSEVTEEDQERIDLTRMFSQNAALLEVADDNFVKIKKIYEKILLRYRVEIGHNHLEIPLNLDSMREYLEINPPLQLRSPDKRMKNTIASEELQKARGKKLQNLKAFDRSQRKKYQS